jgi:predicted transcriptional regulator
MSHKVLLTVHPAIYQLLQARQKLGYGSVQEVINEILRKEFTRKHPKSKRKSYDDYLR